MDDLTAKGGQLVDDLRAAVANLNGTITRLNTEMLKPETFKNLQDSMANLKDTTNNFKAASEKLGGVLDDAHGVVTQAHAAMDGAKDTLASAKAAADDVRGAIGDTRKVLGTVRTAADQAVHGPGLMGTLISNKELSDNMAALVSNLRRSGVLFYKDRAASSPEAGPGPTPVATPAGGGEAFGVGKPLRETFPFVLWVILPRSCAGAGLITRFSWPRSCSVQAGSFFVMTPLTTINLLRALFIIAAGVIGATVGGERLGSMLVGAMLGLVFSLALVLIDRVLKGLTLRVFSSATLRPAAWLVRGDAPALFRRIFLPAA